MKFVKLNISLITTFIFIFFCGTVIAADSFSEAIKNGKIGGEIKLRYQTNDKNSLFDKEQSIFDSGLRLSFNSDVFCRFKAGINFYSVDDLGAYGNLADKSVHGIDHENTAAWLGEAYFQYDISNTMLKFGRQNLKSPMVNSDTWALFPNNFEAYLIQNKDIPDTTLKLAYITEERVLKSEVFDDIAEDGILMLGIVNSSLSDTKLRLYYYFINDINEISSFYLDAKTRIFPITLQGQYMLIDPDVNESDPTNAFGLKASADLEICELSLAITSVDDGIMNAAKFSDNGIKTPLYTATITGAGYIAGATDTDSIKLAVSFTPLEKLKINACIGFYNHGNDSSAYPDEEDTSIELVAIYTGIESVTLFASYFNTDHHGVGVYSGTNVNDEVNSIRFWAKYVF